MTDQLIEAMTDAYLAAAEADGNVIGRDVVTVRMHAVMRAILAAGYVIIPTTGPVWTSGDQP